MVKYKYKEMIIHAILNLGDRIGSSRDGIWKYINMHFPEDITEKKHFLTQLKREM